MKTPGLHNGGTISWPTQWEDNLPTSPTELVIGLRNATFKYTMELTVLNILEAQTDMVGIEPSEQQMIKGDGSKEITIRNEKLVRELEPRKTSLEAQPPMSNMTPLPILVIRVMWRPPSSSPSPSPQPTPPTPSPQVPSTEFPVFEEFVRNNQEG